MNDLNKNLIKEDVEFINDYVRELKKELITLVPDKKKVEEIMTKMERRLKDIESRVEA